MSGAKQGSIIRIFSQPTHQLPRKYAFCLSERSAEFPYAPDDALLQHSFAKHEGHTVTPLQIQTITNMIVYISTYGLHSGNRFMSNLMINKKDSNFTLVNSNEKQYRKRRKFTVYRKLTLLRFPISDGLACQLEMMRPG